MLISTNCNNPIKTENPVLLQKGNWFQRSIKRWFLCGACVFPLAVAIAQDQPAAPKSGGSKVQALWAESQKSFVAGDFPASAKDLELLILCTTVPLHPPADFKVEPSKPNQQWLEPVFFMLGASYFNAKDWPNAINAFQRYQDLFPHASRLMQVTFSKAQSAYFGEKYPDAILQFKKLLLAPFYHEKAVFFLVKIYEKTNDPDDSIALLEAEKARPKIGLFFLEKVNVKLGNLYLQKPEVDKAVLVLHDLDQGMEYVEDATQFNALSVSIGDLLLKNNRVDEALDCYRRIRTNDQIISLQQQQIVNLQRKKAANMALIMGNPTTTDELQLDNKDIDEQIAKDQKILVDYQSLPPILPPILLRVGHAFSVDGRLWEAVVVFREIMRRYPQSTEAEVSHYSSIVSFDHLKRTERARALCESYLQQYPSGKYISSVGFLRGILAYDAEDFDKAVTYLNECLPTQTDPAQKEQIKLILGDVKLREQKFSDAIDSYQNFIKDYPTSPNAEKAEYRSQLALIFAGKMDDAEKGFQAYLAKYPTGFYAPDAEYRLAVVLFSRKEYDATEQACLAWQKKYGKGGPLAEVLSLLGDCYTSQGKNDDAITSYIQSYKVAKTPDVLSYSIIAAGKLLQKAGKWPDILTLFQGFVQDNPDSTLVVSAVGWIGRADVKLGKVEEARQYMADTVKKYANDPSRDALDEIITQLAMLYARKHTSMLLDATPQATPTPVPAPQVSDVDQLAAIMTVPDIDKKPTAQARILFAKAELARIRKKFDDQHDLLIQIATHFQPEQLSPTLLGEAGDALVQEGKLDAADPFYHFIIDEYSDSPVIDYAYNGLAQIAYNQKDYDKALSYYNKALDEGLASTRLKDITLGKAKTLLALNRLDEAKTVFEQIASTREWRGECTAYSVLCLGDIQMQKANYAEANAYFQRVYVAYQKYPEIQAGAYLKSGEVFEKLAKITEARNTYIEMLKNPNLAQYPETADARTHLERLTQQ